MPATWTRAAGAGAAISTAPPAAPRTTTSSCARPCTAASCRAASPGTSTAPKASGAPTSSPRRRPRCGTRSSGTPARRCSTCARSRFRSASATRNWCPLADLVSPNKTHDIRCYEGWAYCARTPDKNIFLAYFEKGCPRSQIRGARLNSLYRAQWFDPRNGTWQTCRRRHAALQRDRDHQAAGFSRRHRLGPAPHLLGPSAPVERLAERTLGGPRGGPPDVWRDGRRCATGHRPRSGRSANELDLTNAG